jgi:hypothetical protein
MGSVHTKLLLHTEVRWLFRSKILLRIFELKDEIRIFLLEHKSTLAEHFLNKNWLVILSYLSDIFDKLNSLNLSLQGKNINILFLSDKIDAF